MPLQTVFPGGQRRGIAAAAVPGPSSTALQEGESRLLVGPQVRLKCAQVDECDTVVVEGALEASMSARVMRVAERGVFKGAADVETAEIRGQFEGELTVRDRLVVHATGQVAGRVRYGRLVIEEGARLSGEVAAGGGDGVAGDGRPG